MDNKTPSKGPNSVFSPIKLRESPIAASPQKNLTGLPRIVADVTADIYNTVQKWNSLTIAGSEIVKRIASLKSDSLISLEPPLEEYTTNLYDVVQDLKKCVDALNGFQRQIHSVVELDKNVSQPLFMSRSTKSIARMIDHISQAYSREFESKVCILENIAHTGNESEAMFLAAMWTYEPKITDETNLNLASLLVETGHWRFV